MKNKLIQLDDVSFSYEQSIALDHISLQGKRGGILGVDWAEWFR